MSSRRGSSLALLVLILGVVAAGAPASASSHREAPGITEMPKVDGTDFYIFNSYEPGRDGFVTMIANYIPLQQAYGGPNYFAPDPDARYNIHIDNTGDGVEDLTLSWQFYLFNKNISLPVGGETVAIPLLAAGQFNGAPGDFDKLNEARLYTVHVRRGPLANPTFTGVLNNITNGGPFTASPPDHAGLKTFPDYENVVARRFINEVSLPGCPTPGRIFTGQRKEPFAVNLGEVFDLVNLNPVGDEDSEPSATEYSNIFSMIVELPASCLTGSGPVIGAWTSAQLPRTRTLRTDPTYENPTIESADFVQVSRLGMPLVNEVVIGVKDKNLFNASQPSNDLANFATYVTNPTLPELLEILFGVGAPNNFPRADLVAAFVTGVTGLNEFGIGEMARLNTSIPSTPRASQSRMGVLGGDNAGFPNGRRPGDDVVDIELRVAMGVLCHAFPGVYCDPADAPAGALPYTDGTLQDPSQFDDYFPYLRPPVAGSPNGLNGV